MNVLGRRRGYDNCQLNYTHTDDSKGLRLKRNSTCNQSDTHQLTHVCTYECGTSCGTTSCMTVLFKRYTEFMDKQTGVTTSHTSKGLPEVAVFNP